MDFEQLFGALPGTVLWVAALVLVFYGLMECFFGYKLLRVVLAIFGALLGALLAWAAVMAVTGGSVVLAVLAALAGGIVGALLLVFLVFYVGIFLLGAQAGYLAGAVVAGALGWRAPVILLLVPAAIAGILAVILRRFIIIVATALGGAWAVVVGISAMVKGPQMLTQLDRPGDVGTLALVCWAALALMGVFVQYQQQPSEGDKEAADAPPPGAA